MVGLKFVSAFFVTSALICSCYYYYLHKYVETDIKVQKFKQNHLQRIPFKPGISKKTKHRILVVSFYRSGSSWFGEFLSTVPKSFYVYEPLHLLNTDNITPEEMYRWYKVPRIEELFHCEISYQFWRHWKNWQFLYPKCAFTNCTTKIITDHCKKSNFIIMKTVRFLLSEVEDILIKPSLKDIKVIFLARDPRGVIDSLSRMDKKMRDRVGKCCVKIRENIVAYSVLKSTFPNNIFFVRYEDIVRYPHETALKIWQFVSNRKAATKIPPSWAKYLKNNAIKKKGGRVGPKDLTLNYTRDWDSWRLKISENNLKFAENNCYDIIKTLGHKNFENINITRNGTFSSLAKNYCSDLPCS